MPGDDSGCTGRRCGGCGASGGRWRFGAYPASRRECQRCCAGLGSNWRFAGLDSGVFVLRAREGGGARLASCRRTSRGCRRGAGLVAPPVLRAGTGRGCGALSPRCGSRLEWSLGLRPGCSGVAPERMAARPAVAWPFGPAPPAAVPRVGPRCGPRLERRFESGPQTPHYAKRDHEGPFLRNGAPERIRTSDLCLRRAALYPAELRAQGLQ